MNSDNTVLLIVGEGRSGSTVIEEILSQISDVISVGELQFVWKRGYFDNQLCGCGTPILTCSFWNNVFSEVKKSHEIERFENSFTKTKYDSFASFPVEILKYHLGLRDDIHLRYFSAISKIYQIIFQKTKARMIVDSSKFVHYAYFLIKYCAKNIDIRVLHLVRDPRGVAFSRNKKKYRTELIGRKEYMPRMGFVKSSIRWSLVNLSIEALIKPATSKYVCMRYEDFSADPRGEIKRALNKLGFDDLSGELDGIFAGNEFVITKKSHAISGNPDRFKSHTKKKIRIDNKWISEMPLYAKFAITFFSFPLIYKYGYIKNQGYTETL